MAIASTFSLIALLPHRIPFKVSLAEQAKGKEGLWWRLRDQCYAAPLDEYDQPIAEGGSREIIADWFTVAKTTPKGVWLCQWGMAAKRFVRLEATKQYACPTLEEAIKSFIARKKRQYGIYKARADTAKGFLDRAEMLLQEQREKAGE